MITHYPPNITPYEQQVAMGMVAGATPVNIFGFNSSVGTSFVSLWENATDIVFPTAAEQMDVVSSSASDTAVSVLVVGLDASYNNIQEVVALNGTTAVTTTASFLRINTVVVVSGNNVGTITLSDGSTYAKIAIGVGKSQASWYTVPAGHTFYLYRIDAFSATANGSHYLLFRNKSITASGTILRVAETTFLNNMNIQRVVPFAYPEKTDIVFQAKSSSSTNEAGIFAEGILIAN